jgi:glycosyltransferase involved in cell wall biosynthesis
MPSSFSVILPCHNAAQWVAQSLASAAAQTHAPHEIIVINDSSTDDTADQVRRCGLDVTLLEVNVRNAAAARNAGAKVATGDWLAFLDADDFWLPHHLAAAAALLSGGNDVAYTSVHQDLHADGVVRTESNPWPWLDRPRGGLTPADFIRCWSRVMYFSMPSTVVRADRFWEVGGLDPDQVRRHDSHLWWRLIHGHSWSFDPRPDCVCRVDTPDSVSRASAARSAFDALRALLKTQPLYAHEQGYPRVLANGAYVAMVEAIAYGQAPDRQGAWNLARTHLPLWQRSAFAGGMIWPGAFRQLVRWRRGERSMAKKMP